MPDKRPLRRSYISARRSLPHDRKDELDRQVFAQLLDTGIPDNATAVLTYVSTAIEVDTMQLINHCLRLGKKLACPRCNDMDGHMSFYYVNSSSCLQTGSYSILEPTGDCLPVEEDVLTDGKTVCIVPGLSFDSFGMRLGYGKGYYDRFLRSFGGRSIGLCYESFLSDRLPTAEHDIGVDIIITERGVYCPKA